jgi:DNA polymerase III epsilon subunit-like protein
MLTKKICVFDFETDGSNPDVCSPVQLSAVIVDPIKLEIISDSEFNVFCKPEVMEGNDEYRYETDIMDFHARVKGCSQDDIYAQWRKYPSQQIAWNSFVSYLDKYHCGGRKKKSVFSAPIAAGYNINRFDLKIINRLSQKYKNIEAKENISSLFYPRDVIDIMNLIFYWFESSELKSYSLDSLRDYLSIDKTGAHDALKDVKDCANILIRFLKLHRRLFKQVNFKGSFANDVKV